LAAIEVPTRDLGGEEPAPAGTREGSSLEVGMKPRSEAEAEAAAAAPPAPSPDGEGDDDAALVDGGDDDGDGRALGLEGAGLGPGRLGVGGLGGLGRESAVEEGKGEGGEFFFEMKERKGQVSDFGFSAAAVVAAAQGNHWFFLSSLRPFS